MAEKGKKHPILVPVDFSPYSEAAVRLASELGTSLNAPLIILHVVHDPGEAPGYYAVKGKKKQLRRLEDVAGEMMEEFVNKMSGELANSKAMKSASHMLVKGLPVTRILEIVDKEKPRMVVMGSQGRTGLKHLFLGSKAEQIVRLCPVPVTIVKDNHETS